MPPHAQAARTPRPDDLIPLAQATLLGPPPPRGGTRQRCTLLRWIQSGKLRGWRVAGYWYVSRSELLAFLEPVEAPAGAEAQQLAESVRRARETDEVLRRHGVRR